MATDAALVREKGVCKPKVCLAALSWRRPCSAPPSAPFRRRETGFVLQKEILRRRGVFRSVVMRTRRRFKMAAADRAEFDRIMELLRPHFRV